MKSHEFRSENSSSTKNNSIDDDITVKYDESELEISFPNHRVKEAVLRWENEFRMSKMTTIDLGGPTTSIESFQDEYTTSGHDRRVCNNQRRPDPPTKDEEELATRQPLLHVGMAVHGVTHGSGESTQALESPNPDAQTVRWPVCEWFQPLPTTTSEPPPSRRRRRCHSTFSRLCFMVVSLICLIMAVKLPAWIQQQNQSTEQKLLHFVDFLTSHGISTREDLERYQSPQYRAAAWAVRWKSKEDVLTRYVLAVLYYALNGEAWPIPFLSDRPVCEWSTRINHSVFGVTSCQWQNSTKGALPTAIILDFEGVSGLLPSEIRHLTTLEHLQIDNNLALGGSLPTTIRQLSRLQSLSFKNCSICGTLPSWLGELTRLRELMLSDNQLKGSLPSQLERLTNLHRLSLKGNMLSSQLESLSKLSNLQFLYLHDNLLQGQLHDSVVTNWNKLVEMDLSENQLSGSLPTSLFTHATLKRINMCDNRLMGTFPSIQAPNMVLNIIRLSTNELEGTIPPSISQLLAIQNLDVDNNILTGTLPDTLSAMSNLTELRLGDNDYSPQPFPKGFLRLSNLQKLSLFRSSLTGSIPDSIGFLSQLQSLDLSENSLRGSLPDTIGYLSLLRHLSLRNNLLTGSLPDSLKNWIRLGTITSHPDSGVFPQTQIVYLSGEIHSDWRQVIADGVAKKSLPVALTSPNTSHEDSDDCGAIILGMQQERPNWDKIGAGMNAIRTKTLLSEADVVVIRFGEKYRQWNAAFDAGYAAALGKPIITMHPPSLSHMLKEVNACANVVCEDPQQVVDTLAYVIRGDLPTPRDGDAFVPIADRLGRGNPDP